MLSVAAALTVTLEANLGERLEWLTIVLDLIDPLVSKLLSTLSSDNNILQDTDIREVAPRIMEVLCQRLEKKFMAISEISQGDTLLRKFPPLTRRARDIASMSRRAGF